MLPFHSEVDVDQKLLFSTAHAAQGGSLSVTVTAAATTMVFISVYHSPGADWNGAIGTDCHSLFSAPATAVMAAIATVAETRAIAHPANFLMGQENQGGD